MLPIVFEKLELVYIFFATFFFSLLFSIGKRSILAKIWGRCSPPVSTKLLTQTANKNITFMFTKSGLMVSEVTVPKNSKQTFPQVEKVTVQKLFIQFWTVNKVVGLLKNICERLLLVKVCSLHIISRNYSNTFLLMNLQEKKFVQIK